jgi:nitric oxide synthase oxygenase domain/subunit
MHHIVHVAAHIGFERTIATCGAKVKTLDSDRWVTITFWDHATCPKCRDLRKADEVSLALMHPNLWLSTRNDP